MTNDEFIRQIVDELFRHLGNIFSISNFNRSVLLYTKAILRPNMRWKALDEIYNFHILLAT